MKKIRTVILFLFLLSAFLQFGKASASVPRSTFRDDAPPAVVDLINAVNALRLTHGLPALTQNAILMKVAQDQAYVLADTKGAAGHERPSGISLTDYLLMLGYPLAGDLTLGGYRSENWVAAQTVQDAISAWLSDDIHTNTMLSENYLDIGAGIASLVNEFGVTQYYLVIDCARPTASGKPQSDYTPVSILTATAFASYVGTPQWMIPIAKNTAQPNGDVIHEVQYGQTLWGIAIAYNTTIENLRRLNNLPPTPVIRIGQKLIVQRSATQSALQAATVAPTLSTPKVTATFQPFTPHPTFTSTSKETPLPKFEQKDFGAVIAILFAALVLGFVLFKAVKK